MTLNDISEKLNLKLISGSVDPEVEVTNGYASDLLSDVMGNAAKGDVWVTLQTHKNIIAVAMLKEIAAIILVKGMVPDADTLAQSNIEGIPVFSTSKTSFETVGLLYQLLNHE